MSLNPTFKPLEDFYFNEGTKPLSVNDLPVETFRDDPGQMVMPNTSKPLVTEPVNPTPGFFDTLEHAWSQNNEEMQAGRFISREAQFSHPSDDPVPDGFDPRALEHLEAYPTNYWDFISMAHTPNELSLRQQYVQEKMNDEEEYANGSLMAKLIGGAGGAITSLSTLIPLTSSVKYASLSQSMIRNAFTIAPSLGVQAIAHNGFMQATEAGGNLQDLAVDTIRDTAFGVAFLAGGAGLGYGMRGAKLWNTRKMVNIIHEGAEVHPIIGEDGELAGVKVLSGSNEALSAQKLSQADTFANAAMHQGFLFHIPGIGKMAGNGILGSPLVQGKLSRFKTIHKLVDLMASHTILTKEVLEGQARADSAEDIMSAINAGAVDFTMQMKSQYYNENGIIGGVNAKNAIKALKQKALTGQSMSEEDFYHQVIGVVINVKPHESKHVNEAAKLYTEYTDKLWSHYLNLHGMDPNILPPRNARGYFTISPDATALVKYQKEFREVISSEFMRQDKVLAGIMQPLNVVNAVLDQLKKVKYENIADAEVHANKIKEARALRRSIMKEIETKARSGKAEDEDYAMLTLDRNFLSTSDSSKLFKLLRPARVLKKKVAAKSHDVNSTRMKLNNTLEAINKNKSKKGTAELKSKAEELKKELEQAQTELDKLKGQHLDAQEKLDISAREGKVPANFFTRDENVIEWRDPKEWLKFREAFKSESDMVDAAEAQRNVYLNNTSEQVQGNIMHNMMPNQFANPIGRRTFMVPAKLMHENNFIRKDVPGVAHAYARALGRHIALKTVFKDINIKAGEFGPEGMARILSEERTAQELEINNKDIDEAAKHKELLKLQRDFDKAKTYMGTMHDIFMGKTRASAATVRMVRNLKNFAVATKLGSTIISQLNDVSAVILKHGLWNYVRDGLFPVFKSIGNSELTEARMRNAADAALSIQHVHSGYATKYSESNAVGDVPVATHLESAIKGLANLSGNFFGINRMDNANQRVTAGIMQAKIMRHMFSFKDGTLGEKDLQGLLGYGLDPKVWADRFIEAYQKSGGWQDSLGAYQSKYWDWADDGAVARMAMTLRRGVADTVLQKGLYTSPFWANDPFMSMIFMFHGYAFAAFNRFTVPLMQRADADKVLGITLMLGFGAMSDMLRDLARGNKPDLEHEHTIFGRAMTAVSNSGVLGHTTDILQSVNKLLDGNLLPEMTTRYKDRNKWSLLGPVAGMSGDVANLYKSVLTGTITSKEAKRAATLIPLAGSVQTRFLLNKFIDNLDLPEKRESE